MQNKPISSICFRLRSLPDVQSPRLVTAFGERAADIAERIVFNGLMLVSSHARANENLVFTLRYLIDNSVPQNPETPADPRDRLRIYVILVAEKEDLSPGAFSIAAEILRAQLGICFASGGNQAAIAAARGADGDEPVAGNLETLPNWQEQFARIWDGCPYICHVVKHEFIALDEGENRSSQSGRSNFRQNDSVPQTGLRGVYLPWPYRSDEQSSAPDALFWDRLADAVAPSDPTADRRQFCVDLVFRPATLAPGDPTWAGLSAQLARNRDMSRDRTATTDMVGDIYQSYWDLCAQGNLFDFGMRVAGSDGEATEWLAGSIATALTGGGHFRVNMLPKNSAEWKDSLDAGRYGLFDAGFVHSELRDLDPSMRRMGVKHWSRLLDTDEGRKLRGTLENIPKLSGLARLKYLIDVDTAGEFLRLPVTRQGYPSTIRLDTEKRPSKDRSIHLGPETERAGNASIPLDALTGHMFITGATGSGKTTTMYHLLAQLWEDYNIPFLVIEPVKKQYRSLKMLPDHPKLSQDLIVFTVGQSRVTPLRFNPLRFGPVTLNEHLGALETCFRGSMPFFDPLPTLFMEMLEKIYQDKSIRFSLGYKTGLEFIEEAKSQDIFPLIAHLINYWKKHSADIMNSIGYGKDVAANIRGALIARMKELNQPYLRDLFEPPILNIGRKSQIPNQPRRIDLPLDQLLSRPVVLELDALNIRQANLLTLFILSTIREHRRAQAQTKDLKHILVIEEAHNLVGSHTGPISGENSVNPAAAATQFMVQMLAEVRALGQGLIIVDQTPAAVAPEVLKNTNLKLVHRTTDGDDRVALANSMLLSPAQGEDVARLGRGFAYFYQPDLYRPVGVYVNASSQIQQIGNVRVDDAELRKRQVEETLQSLVEHTLETDPIADWADVPEETKFDLYMTILHSTLSAYMTKDAFLRESEQIPKALKTFRNKLLMEVDHGLQSQISD
jgi:DNA helicase HerA-like ATPase